MDKRYQVFVSSTFTDLKDERQAVIQALLSLDHFPAGMEAFPASDDDAWTLIKGVINDSDYYVLVIGGRYGSINEEGISYTEMEFDYAVSARKPVLAFVHHSPEEIPSGKTDQSDSLRAKLTAFRQKVEANHHVKHWKNPDELKALVIQSISAETRRNPQEGWVRASRASDPVVVERLREENESLKSQLDSARDTPPQGAEQYAGGDDTFDVTFGYQLGDILKRKNYVKIFQVTWNNIFYQLGPMLLEEASEESMQGRLSVQLRRFNAEGFPNEAVRIKLKDDSFETIKVQLLALGLIARSERKHPPSDTNKYWSLTPFGERTMMKLRAIPKSAA